MAKNVVAKAWNLPVVGGRRSSSAAQTGLQFLANGVTGSDVRIHWNGANLPSRTSHTVIWKALYFQQTGYYADVWHCQNDGNFNFSGMYEYGTHPYPSDATFDSSGQANVAPSVDKLEHWFEIAGLGGHDYISSAAGSSSKKVVKNIWYTHARTCEIVGGTVLRHRFWPDVVNDSTFVIEQNILLANLNSPSTTTFVVGCSPWTSSNFGGSGSGYTNSETPGSVIRSVKIFNTPLSTADIASEAASGSNAAVTSAGIASVHYINENPTPSDVSDKSGAGHTPVYANLNRPTLWSS